MSSYLAVSPLPTTVETVAGGLLSVALFPDLAIGGRYPPSYPAESGLSSKERLATLSPRPSVRLLSFSFSTRNAENALRFPNNYNLERVLFNAARPIFSIFSPRSRRFYRRRVRRRKIGKTRRLRKRRKTGKINSTPKRIKISKKSKTNREKRLKKKKSTQAEYAKRKIGKARRLGKRRNKSPQPLKEVK